MGYHAGGNTNRYADVLFTPQLVARRDNQESGYRILEAGEVVDNIAMVSAAAPNLGKQPHPEIFDQQLILQAMRSIIVIPKLRNPKIDVLILGAWGCGAFGCDPEQVATIFAHALVTEKLGRLYKEIHFAIKSSG